MKIKYISLYFVFILGPFTFWKLEAKDARPDPVTWEKM